MLEALSEPAPDALMEVVKLYRGDPRSRKLDFGIGTYRNAVGNTPVMAAVKSAELHLTRTQDSKCYLGPAGDLAFLDKLRRLTLPSTLTESPEVVSVQTPGGTGAFRLGAEIIKLASPESTVFVGLPTWPNHLPILDRVGLRTQTFTHYDVSRATLEFDSLLKALHKTKQGDIIVLHASCHNPSGADYTLEQWKVLADFIQGRDLVPFIDLAYHGMGLGLSEDLRGASLIMAAAQEALLAVSCSKSFGLYRDRVGALFVLASGSKSARTTLCQLEHIARSLWSMPPDHGAAIVRTILESNELSRIWQEELCVMRDRVNNVRASVRNEIHMDLKGAFGSDRFGMFSLLPLSPKQIRILRDEHAIYLAANGRMNIAGLKAGHVEQFCEAVASVL